MKRILVRVLLVLLALSLALPAAQAEQSLLDGLLGRESSSGSLTEGHILTEGRLHGSCQILRGDVELAVVFVSVGATDWNMADITAMHTIVSQAVTALEAEAADFGVRLDITPSYYHGTGSDNPDEYNWEHNVLATVPELSGLSAADWFNRPILFCMNIDGRSFTITTYSRTSLEYVVFYMDYDPSTIRHELLHLYGAEDYYFHDDISAAAERHFPGSIMLHSNSAARVDSLSAYLIGWTAEPDAAALAFLQDTAHLTDDDIDAARDTDQQTGVGVFHQDNGMYYGEMEMGCPNGTGFYKWDSGDTYTGDWDWNYLHGKGTYTWSDGESYTGDFVKDLCTGFGTYSWPNGDYYSGTFLEDDRTGKGTYYWAEGDCYTGDFIDGDRTGKGTITWTDGSFYTGDFINGVRTGKGTTVWPDGITYSGDYVNDIIHGRGVLTWPDGTSYTGDFADGEITGLGMMQYEDGSVYIGHFLNGNPHGIGAMYAPDGSVQSGQWENGAFVSP